MLRDNSKADKLTQIILRVIDEKNPKSVKHLTAILIKNIDFDEEEILASVMKLRFEGKINLGDNSLESGNFESYIKAGGSIWYWIMLAAEVMIGVVVFTISEDFYPWIYIKNVFGVVFVLFLPGYAFTKALFPVNIPNGVATGNLETIERIALSFGMSLALVSIIGLLLYYSPWGMGLTAIVLSLLAFTSVFATVGVIREYHAKKTSLEGSLAL